MKIKILASGSKGNITYLEYKSTKILIDCGMNITYIVNQMKKHNLNIDELDAVLITHSHNDHIKGLKFLLKRKNIPVYLLKEMLQDLSAEHNIFYKNKNRIKDIDFEILKTSHDKPSVGFLFKMDKEVVYITDTGYLKNTVLKKIENKSIYIMESNHDIEILMNGSYPHFLKRRILSDKGHLSNDVSLGYLKKIVGEKTESIVLAHLSENNNDEKKVMEMFSKQFSKQNIYVAKQKEVITIEVN